MHCVIDDADKSRSSLAELPYDIVIFLCRTYVKWKRLEKILRDLYLVDPSFQDTL